MVWRRVARRHLTRARRVQFQTLDDLYCKYKFVVGPDWKAVGGPDAGTSQTSRKGSADDEEVVWNFPVDVAFKATSAYGWPRVVLSVRRQCSVVHPTPGVAS